MLVAVGDFERARVDLDKEVELERGYYNSYKSAPIALKLDDADAYRQSSNQLLRNFQNSDSPSETHFAVWTCALADAAVEDYTPAIKLARHAVEKEPTNQQHLNGFGAILMRASKFVQAKEYLGNALVADNLSKTSSSYTHCFLAMTEPCLGDDEAARQQLVLADQSAAEQLAGSPS